MSSHHSRTLKIAAAWLAIILAGVIVGWLVQRGERRRMVAQLLADAQRSAVAFDEAEMRRLSGTSEDVARPDYVAVKARLRKLKEAHPQVRFVYLFRALGPAHRVIFLADSATPGAMDESEPGDLHAQATRSPGLQDVIRTGQPAMEGPLADDYGTWVTGYALVSVARAADGTELAREILGLDVDARHWTRALWQAGFQGAFYVWMLLGLPFVALLVSRRQGEQREVIRNLSEAMEQSHSAILIVDLESRVEYANRGLCQQIGYSRRELIGRKWREFHVLQSSENELADLVATVRAGRRWDGEWVNKRKDGSTYPVRGVVTPVKHRDGTLACFVAVFDDVTEAKRKEDELRDARDLAEAGDRAKGQFLATMSHEVRTPLNGIVGFTSLLLDTPLSQEQREYVQTIRVSTEALIQLTGDILDFARIESGKLKLEPLACDPRECVEDALDLLAARAVDKNIELLHRVADDVPSAVVTDGGRLRQILVNLVGNAIKFTERGEVEVSIAVERPPAGDSSAPAGDCKLEFHVRDTGIGIAGEHMPRLFKPFSQVDETSTRRYGGTGLGLAISRNLVHLLGGEITLKSEPGRGSTFSFTIHAPIAAALPPQRDLGGLRVGLALRGPLLRREMSELMRKWRAEPIDTNGPAELARANWDVALVEVDADMADELVNGATPFAGLPAAKAFALVPINLANDLRTVLRAHFRLLVNKPVHHGGLYGLLTGSRPAAPIATPPTHFGFRVLVVEDNPVNQRLIQRVLTNLGCTWKVLENGRQAVEELGARSVDYDIILLDLHMPEMDGIAALQEIRAGQAGLRAQTMWIIALTADARENQKTRGIAAGLNDYLTKPVKLGELETAFRKFRAERGARRR